MALRQKRSSHCLTLWCFLVNYYPASPPLPTFAFDGCPEVVFLRIGWIFYGCDVALGPAVKDGPLFLFFWGGGRLGIKHHEYAVGASINERAREEAPTSRQGG